MGVSFSFSLDKYKRKEIVGILRDIFSWLESISFRKKGMETSILFFPSLLCSSRNVKVRRSITLLAQVLLPIISFAGETTKLLCIGGSNVPTSPQIDDYQMVFFPLLQRFGVSVDIDLIRRGFYPRGGGRICFQVCSIRCFSFPSHFLFL